MGLEKETVKQQIDAVILEYQITAITGALLGSCKSYMEALKAWNEKINNIKLAYETIKNDVGDLLPLLAVLKELKQQGNCRKTRKWNFLNCCRIMEKASINSILLNLDCSVHLVNSIFRT